MCHVRRRLIFLLIFTLTTLCTEVTSTHLKPISTYNVLTESMGALLDSHSLIPFAKVIHLCAIGNQSNKDLIADLELHLAIIHHKRMLQAVNLSVQKISVLQSQRHFLMLIDGLEGMR